MAVIGFWGGDTKESGQTLSATAIATYMCVEHNLRTLLIDANFHDDTMERCFWRVGNDNKSTVAMLNKGKIDISSGAEGLVSAIASNKTTPEIITNFTRVVFKNRLDVLCGLKTNVQTEFTKSLMLYKDLLLFANKYYDLVFIDLEKTLAKETTRVLLENCHVIVYSFSPNLRQISTYLNDMRKNTDILKQEKVIPLLSKADDKSKYNLKNVTRFIKSRKEIASVPYSPIFMEAASEAGVANFYLQARLSAVTSARNSLFLKAVDNTCKTINKKLEELKYIV